MTARDERYRRDVQRLKPLVIALAAEVVARGGPSALEDYGPYQALTDEEKAQAVEMAPLVFRDKFAWLLEMREQIAASAPQTPTLRGRLGGIR